MKTFSIRTVVEWLALSHKSLRYTVRFLSLSVCEKSSIKPAPYPAVKAAVSQFLESHVSRTEQKKRNKKKRQDPRLHKNFFLHHVLGVLFFFLLLRSLMAFHMLCRVTLAISRVMAKLRLYHSLVGKKGRWEEWREASSTCPQNTPNIKNFIW